MIQIEETRTNYQRHGGDWIERDTIHTPDALESYKRDTDPGAPEYWKRRGVLYRKRTKHTETGATVTITLLKGDHKQKRRYSIT